MYDSTFELIEKVKKITPLGFEVLLRMGALTSTKAIFFRNEKYYLFNMDEDFLFDSEDGYLQSDFLCKYSDWLWTTEQIIS